MTCIFIVYCVLFEVLHPFPIRGRGVCWLLDVEEVWNFSCGSSEESEADDEDGEESNDENSDTHQKQTSPHLGEGRSGGEGVLQGDKK